MKFFKSLFSRFHASIVVFTLVNILMGIALSLSAPFYSKAALIHLIAGILIIPVPILILLVIKKRKLAWQAFSARFFISRKDTGKVLLLIAKITAWMFLISLIISAFSGISIKTGLAAKILPDTNLMLLHSKAIFMVPALLVVHIITMVVAYPKKTSAEHPKA